MIRMLPALLILAGCGADIDVPVRVPPPAEECHPPPAPPPALRPVRTPEQLRTHDIETEIARRQTVGVLADCAEKLKRRNILIEQEIWK